MYNFYMNPAIQNSTPCLAQTFDNKIKLIYKLYSICFWGGGNKKQERGPYSKERNVSVGLKHGLF